MQGYLSQATIAAPEPRRSSGASAGTPKHARRQGQRPPIADRRAPPARTPAAAGPSSAVTALKAAAASPLAQHGRESRDAIPCSPRRAPRPDGPCPTNKNNRACQVRSPPPGLPSVTPLDSGTRPAAGARRERDTNPDAPDAQAPPQTHRTRERVRRIVSGPWAPGATERRRGRDVVRGGKVASGRQPIVRPACNIT